MLRTKLVCEAERVYSYQLARDLLQRAIQSVETEEDLTELQRQIQEKDATIRELREQLEALQHQITPPDSIPPLNDPPRRRLRSLHQVSDLISPATPIKPPSLTDLSIQSTSNPPSKPTICNVEYEEFNAKFEIAPSEPASDFVSPDFFRQKEVKPVLNWSNLQSPHNTGFSPITDSLILKETEKVAENSGIWTDKKPKSHQKGRILKAEIPITLDKKLRARSQSHSRGRKSSKDVKSLPLPPPKVTKNVPNRSNTSIESQEKPLERLLGEVSDVRKWSETLEEIKANPSYLSELLTPGPGKIHRKFSHSSRPVQAVPVFGLNSVMEEDEESSRSHYYEQLPELNVTRDGKFGPVVGATPRKHPSSVPRSRPKAQDWSDSPLDAYAMGGNFAFNWDKRNGIYTEKEADGAFFRLHSAKPDRSELQIIYTKAVNTIKRLLDELMLPKDYVKLQKCSLESAIYALRQIKRLLEVRKVTVKLLSLVHRREDQLLTLFSLEEGREREKLAGEIESGKREIVGVYERWRGMEDPERRFVYLGCVSGRQDYIEKLQSERGLF